MRIMYPVGATSINNRILKYQTINNRKITSKNPHKTATMLFPRMLYIFNPIIIRNIHGVKKFKLAE
jgi:hypothetical protein